MKRILFCTSHLENYQTGSGAFAQLFVLWAQESGMEIDIITENSQSTKYVNLVKHNTLFTKLPILNIYHRSFIFYKTVQPLIKVKKYDFIFFNSVIESLHTARFITDIPVVGFLHDENFMNDYFLNPGFLRKQYRRIIKKHERKAAKHLDLIVTNSKYMKNSIEKYYDIHPIKIKYLYFQTQDLFPSINEKSHKIKIDPTGKINILFIKHDFERGGLYDLIDALQEIKQYNFHLTIIGPHSDKHKKIRKLLGDLSFEIIENADRNQVRNSYKKADIFCVPSHSEALGLGNFEAMNFGIPVVTSNLPIMKELNQGREILLIAEKNNLKSAIIQCIEEHEKTNTRIENAHKFVDQELTKEIIFSALDHVFSTM